MENKDLCTREYTLLFNGLTDTIAELEEMLLRMKRLQAKAEELVMEKEE